MRIVCTGLILIFLIACNKETKYVYNVEDVNIEQVGAVKPNVKKSTEYISIAYSDIFGKAIPSTLLDELTKFYVAFGDVTVIEDLIIRNFLNEPTANVPSNDEMRKDIPVFVSNCYKQFFGRNPTGQEAWFIENKIKENLDLTPDVIYYSFLTSNEYRQF